MRSILEIVIKNLPFGQSILNGNNEMSQVQVIQSNPPSAQQQSEAKIIAHSLKRKNNYNNQRPGTQCGWRTREIIQYLVLYPK